MIHINPWSHSLTWEAHLLTIASIKHATQPLSLTTPYTVHILYGHRKIRALTHLMTDTSIKLVTQSLGVVKPYTVQHF